MPNPTISVLLPVCNAQEHLPGALDSVLCQTLHDLELIIIDDGSTDDTPSILARYAAQDRRIRLLSFPQRRGIVAALNTGIEAANGDFLARMDADDLCHARRLEAQLSLLLKQDDIDLVGCRVKLIAGDRITDGYRDYEKWLNSLVEPDAIARDIFIESPVAHPTFLARGNLFRNMGGYRDCGWPEDYDFLLRCWLKGIRMAKSEEILFFWRDTPQRLSRVAEPYRFDRFRQCKIHFLMESHLKNRHRVTLCGAGLVGKAWSKDLRRYDVETGHFVEVDPRKIGKTIHGAPVVSYGDLSKPWPEFILNAVGARNSRAQVRRALTKIGLAEGADFLCVA
jgi:glycosyltransferase involved in cell wall biosynthesis